MALLAYRSTPLGFTKHSPAELFMGRRLATAVPTAAELLQPFTVTPQSFSAADSSQKEKSVRQYNLRHRSVIQPALYPGDEVIDISTPSRRIRGSVVGTASEPRSYHIRLPSGIVRRTGQICNRIPFYFRQICNRIPFYFRSDPRALPIPSVGSLDPLRPHTQDPKYGLFSGISLKGE